MKRLLLLLIALLLLALGVRWLVRAFASDETRVRWRIEQMRDGFNDSELAPVVDALSPRFVETESGADVNLVEQALMYVYLQEFDAKSKSFALIAACDVDAWQVDVAAEEESDSAQPKRATARGECRLLRKDGEARKLLWRVDAALELEEDRTDGWIVTRATLLTLEGARRAR